MLPEYTFALGGTEKIRQFLQWLESQPATVKYIREKQVPKEPAV